LHDEPPHQLLDPDSFFVRHAVERFVAEHFGVACNEAELLHLLELVARVPFIATGQLGRVVRPRELGDIGLADEVEELSQQLVHLFVAKERVERAVVFVEVLRS
jgi:hypothetical protein